MHLEKELTTAQQSAQQSAVQAEQSNQEVQQQLSEVAGRFSAIEDVTSKFKHIKIGGYVRSRWWTGDHQSNSFDVTEIALQLRYDVSENISGEFHLWFHPNGNAFAGAGSEYANWAGPTTFMESGFAEIRNLNISLGEELGVINGKLIVGKTRNQAFGIVPAGNYNGRVTSDYSLFHQSVNISRITGLQYLTSYKNIRWNFALFNGWGYSAGKKFGARNADIRYMMVSQDNTDDNSNKAFTTRMAYVFDRSDCFDKLEIGASYLKEDLSTRDRENIYEIMGRGLRDDGKTAKNYSKKDEKFGFDFALDKGPYMLKAEYMHGDTSEVKADYWYVMPGYLLSKVSNIPVDFFLRYSEAKYDESRVADIAGSGAWDKSQWTALVKWHLHKRAKIYFEYYWNDVDAPTGASAPSNDYAFIELILMY
jgi:predicted porin